MTQWDFQNKGKSGWTGTSSFVLEVPLRHLRPSVIYSVPCDRILQRAYSTVFTRCRISPLTESLRQPRSQGLFAGLGTGREKTLASAGHVPILQPEILANKLAS